MLIYFCGGGGEHIMWHLWELALFHKCGHWDHTQIVRLSTKCLYLTVLSPQPLTKATFKSNDISPSEVDSHRLCYFFLHFKVEILISVLNVKLKESNVGNASNNKNTLLEELLDNRKVEHNKKC